MRVEPEILAEITADTITDDQVRTLRAMLLLASGNQMTEDTDATGMALTDPDDPRYAHVRDVAAWSRSYGRERCVEILRARGLRLQVTAGTITDDQVLALRRGRRITRSTFDFVMCADSSPTCEAARAHCAAIYNTRR